LLKNVTVVVTAISADCW